MWEENPIGTWTLEIQNEGRSIIQLIQWGLVLHGTETNPQPDAEPVPVNPPAPQPAPVQPEAPVSHSEAPEAVDTSMFVTNCAEQLSSDWCSR